MPAATVMPRRSAPAGRPSHCPGSAHLADAHGWSKDDEEALLRTSADETQHARRWCSPDRHREDRLRGTGRRPGRLAHSDRQPRFVAFSVLVGLSDLVWAQENVFAGSLAIVLFLIARLMRELPAQKARALIGTAIIIFVFRSVPLPGPGLTWFEIDMLGFDERFLAILSLVTSCLTLAGLIVLRPLMAKRSIAFIVVLLTVAAAVLALPNIGLYYGVHAWTSARTAGVVDARFIAILDTAIESPLGQVAMIPMLAWIARNAPAHLKATFFAVMASFTNLALSASSILTRRLNEVFVVTQAGRETTADYGALGQLLIAVAMISLAAPLLAVRLIQGSRFRTSE